MKPVARELQERVGREFLTRGWLRPGAGLVVAVSGGLDSMVLLRILAELAVENTWRLVVAHFNHGLRGAESEADEALVRAAAAELGLAVQVERGAVREAAAAAGVSLEMGGRRLRHDFLARVARGAGAADVALAHHADDQVELFFLRLLRGSGPAGWAGMKWANPSSADAGVRLLRPLLGLGKAELRAWAAERGLKFREDGSNGDWGIPRNRVRGELLPLLEAQYQPALREVILRQMEIWAAELEWEERGEAEIGAAADDGVGFADWPVARQRRSLRRQLRELGVPPGFDLVEVLRTAEGVRVGCGEGRMVSRDARGRVEVGGTTPAATRFQPGELVVPLTAGGGRVEFGGVAVEWAVGAGVEAGRTEGVWFDADRVGAEIVLRHWRPGDRFQPCGMAGHVKLQDWFTNQKVPRERRHGLVVAATRSGEIFWVEGARPGQGCLPGPLTERRLHWRWNRLY